MDFKVSSTALYNRLSSASKVLANKNSIPILDCFLFNIQDGILTITASDSEKYLITTLPTISASDNAVFCITAKTIIDSIKELPEQPLMFSFNADTYSLKGDHSSGHFNLIAQDAAPYPMPMTTDENSQKIIVPCETLIDSITYCLFATANDEVRKVMNGIYFDVRPENIIYASTDGRKLVRYTTINKNQSDLTTSLILPKKVASIIKAVLSKDDGDATIYFDPKRGCVQTEDITLYFSLIEGRYPNYNAVVPKDNPYTAIIDRQSLVSAVKRVQVFCNQSSGLIKLELNNNTVRISGCDNEMSTSAEEYLSCEYNNTPAHIGFSAQLFLEIINIIESENVLLELGDPSRPGIIRQIDEKSDEELLMLLMPMRVGEY